MFPSRWTVDELRGTWAVLRSGSYLFTVPRAVLPAGTEPDDRLRTTGERVGAYPVWIRARRDRRDRKTHDITGGPKRDGEETVVTIPGRHRLEDRALEGGAFPRTGDAGGQDRTAGLDRRAPSREKTLTNPPARIRVIRPD